MIDYERIVALSCAIDALFYEVIPSLYAITIKVHPKLVEVHYIVDDEITEFIEESYYGFMFEICDNIDYYFDSYHYKVSWNLDIYDGDLKELGDVVYLRKTVETYLYHSIKDSDFSKPIKSDFVCEGFTCNTIQNLEIDYYDYILEKYVKVNEYITFTDNNISMSFPIRPLIQDELLFENIELQNFINDIVWPYEERIWELRILLTMQKIFLGKMIPSVKVILINIEKSAFKLFIFIDSNDDTEKEIDNFIKCLSALLFAEFRYYNYAYEIKLDCCDKSNIQEYGKPIYINYPIE